MTTTKRVWHPSLGSLTAETTPVENGGHIYDLDTHYFKCNVEVPWALVEPYLQQLEYPKRRRK
jgi:hypothetical protein